MYTQLCWATPNPMPHPDVREAACQLGTSSARAGGRERYGSKHRPVIRRGDPVSNGGNVEPFRSNGRAMSGMPTIGILLARRSPRR